LPELAVGRYDRNSDIASASRISITKKDKTFEYTYELSTDDGGSIKAEGPVQFVGDRIDLLVRKLEQDRDFTHNGKRFAEMRVMPFFLIKWDKRTYLVGEDELDHFCNEVNLGTESPRDGGSEYFSRDEGEGKADKGVVSMIPDIIPTHAKEFILDKSISGYVLSIEGGRAKIDLGEREQVWENMVLYCEPDKPEKKEMLNKGGKKGEEEFESHRVLLKVVEVHKDHCVVEIYRNQRKHNIDGIRDGYRVYSRFPDLASRKGIF
jgi:hypothetical protein